MHIEIYEFICIYTGKCYTWHYSINPYYGTEKEYTGSSSVAEMQNWESEW